MSISPRLAMPWAFDVFQYWIGGTIAKRKLVLAKYTNQKRVLEIGCASGNIAPAFLHSDVDYTGLDIDRQAIAYATRKFARNRRFTFVCDELEKCTFDHDFDFIFFSGMLHHVDDAKAVAMLEFSAKLLSPDGVLLVSDPVTPRPSDNVIIKWYRKIERGQHVRTFEKLSALVSSLRGLRVLQKEYLPVTALPVFARPTVSHFGVYVLARSKDAKDP